jgi:hypothetical protein
LTYSVVAVVAIAIRPVVHDVIVESVIAVTVFSIFIMELLHFNPREGKRFKLKNNNDLILVLTYSVDVDFVIDIGSVVLDVIFVDIVIAEIVTFLF